MINKITCVLIWSEDPFKLAQFYENTLELKKVETLTHPEDTGILFNFSEGGPCLWVGKHSKVNGTNNDQFRHMINLGVDSVSAIYEKLSSKGVKFIAKPFPNPIDGTSWFATFEDPEGNILQLWSKNK